VDQTNALAVDHPDGLGSVRALTDATGKVIETDQTDEFGKPVTSTRSGAQRLRYNGEEQDEYELINLRARACNPVLKRFMGRDPFPDFRSLPQTLHRER